MKSPIPTLRIVRFVHRAYKLTLSPLFGNACRFTPFCSDYALEAIEQHGFWRGVWLGLCRVVRCNPWSAGGDDPVPLRSSAPRRWRSSPISGKDSAPLEREP